MEAEKLGRLRKFLLVNELEPVLLKDGTGILMNLSGMEVLSLNATGMFIVGQILGGSDTLDVIATALCQEFSVERATAENEARSFVDELAEQLKVP